MVHFRYTSVMAESVEVTEDSERQTVDRSCNDGLSEASAPRIFDTVCFSMCQRHDVRLAFFHRSKLVVSELAAHGLGRFCKL
jgi:hypothetical protein